MSTGAICGNIASSLGITLRDRPRNGAPLAAMRTFLKISVMVLTTSITLAGLSGDTRAALPPTSASSATISAPRPGYQQPAGDVISPFNPPPKNWLSGHRGVDLAVPLVGEVQIGEETVLGNLVLAPASGQVTVAGLVFGTPTVTIAHPDGMRSSFQPLIATVARGDWVAAGDVLGYIGEWPAHCAFPCVHWGVRPFIDNDDIYLDPLILIGAPPIVLMPLP